MSFSLTLMAKAMVQRGIYRARPRSGTHSARYSKEWAYILSYHSVCPVDDAYVPYIGPNLSVTPEMLARQIAFLDANYQVVSLSELVRSLAAGYDGDRPLVALTFDDGYRDNYLYAFPILRRFGVEATFFLTTDCIDSELPLWPLEVAYILLETDRRRLTLGAGRSLDLQGIRARRSAVREVKAFLTDLPRARREAVIDELRFAAGIGSTAFLCDAMLRWHEVREMRNAGMAFGSHTCSHPSLPYIPEREAADEILLSKKAVEDVIEEQVEHFCYPNPAGRHNFNETLSAMLKASGFTTSVTSRHGYVEMNGSPFEMRRKGIYRIHDSLPAFYCHLEEEAIARWRRGLLSGRTGAGASTV